MTTLTPRPGTPAAAGYRMPAEWEPHEATWLSWPHNRESWPGKFEPVPGIWALLVRTLAAHEPVHVLAGRLEVMTEAVALVGDVPGVTLHDVRTNDAWTRDHGPTFLVGPRGATPMLVDWEYNAWGGKYPPFDDDNRVPEQVAAITGYHRVAPGIVLEGGAIDPNGQGLILTSEQCLLNPNRNPGLSRGEIEQYLADYLGARRVLWLGEGIAGDDTDGHIDELARFVGPRTVVAMEEPDPTDDNHAPLADNLQRLRAMRDLEARPLEIITLPMPRPMYQNDQRLPGSYCNFYIANGLVIVPQYDDPADSKVVETLRPLFPNREVIPLPARDLSWGLGAYHCITQQQPRTD